MDGATYNSSVIEEEYVNGTQATWLTRVDQHKAECELHCKMNDYVSGDTTVLDYSGNSRNGTNVKDTWNASVRGRVTYGIEYPNTTDYTSFGDILDTECAYNQPWSVSLWIKDGDGSGANECWIGKMDNSGDYTGWIFEHFGNNATFILRNDNSPANYLSVNTTTVALGGPSTWTHLVVTYDGSTNAAGVKIYVNGKSLALNTAADSLSATIANSQALVTAARNSGGTDDFSGDIDDLRIYSKELNADEVADIFNCGKGFEGGLSHDTVNTLTLAVMDSGAKNSTWDMSTFRIYENPAGEEGSWKYKYAFGNTVSPDNFQTGWLASADVVTQDSAQGRYLLFQCQSTTTHSTDATLAGGYIECVVNGDFVLENVTMENLTID